MKQLLSATFICLLLAASFTTFGQKREKETKEETKERTFFEGQSNAERAEEMVRSAERASAEASERSSARSSGRSSERSRSSYRTPSGSSYSIKSDYPSNMATTYSTGDVFMMSSSGSSSSQLSLSKSFDGKSSDNEGTFNVDKSVRHISLQLSGSVKEGAIEIIITLPDGDELKEITIDTSADIQFTQSIKISEEEDKYYGQWEYSVESDEAVGYYRLSIRTN